MNNNVKVSIVTPSYNQGQFIEETILSVLNQTYQNIQYIVVDGGSSDQTMEIVKRYADKIDIIIHEKDKGQSDAINKGFKLADGDLVGWINSDDILYPECVENIVALSKEKQGGSIYYNCNNRLINGQGKLINEYTIKIRNFECLLKRRYSLIQQGSFYSRRLVKEVGYLDDSIDYCMDLDLWLKLLKLGPIYYSDLPPLSAFRIWEETKTSTGNQKFLSDIRSVLYKNGAHIYDKTIRKTYWYTFKANVKDILTIV